MKRSHSFQRPRAPRQHRQRATKHCEQALRACEAAALRIRSAGDELAANWTALCDELSTSLSTTDLLRRRAWCNVLELRLKEQAHALEAARQIVDGVWGDAMVAARTRQVFGRDLKRDAEELVPSRNLPLLQPVSHPGAESRTRMAAAK